jgi:SRSO17 transposase
MFFFAVAFLDLDLTFSAQHQLLLHFVAQSPWSDARVLVLELTLPSITARESIEAWIIEGHELSKEGQALGVRHPAVLRAARQAGQLPSRTSALSSRQES